MKWLNRTLESPFFGAMCAWSAAIKLCEQIGMTDWRIVAVPFAIVLAYWAAAKDREISK
jgi:hypothetical protein